MKKLYEKICNNSLWSGINETEFTEILNCLNSKIQNYKKEEVIIWSGDPIDNVGFVIYGNVKIMKEDINGNNTIITFLSPSDLFAEVFACAQVEFSPVTVQAVNDCQILFIDFKKVIHSTSCPFHYKLIENMLRIVAQKNLIMNQKLEILSKKTTREKLLSYFDTIRGKKTKFYIPFNREELAHFLCVDRSALSNELSKLQSEGIIYYKKNYFEIKS